MEVKVDSNLIKAEREKRGWSQGHLASVAGLSLRTIQRIEKTGSASFESVTALASVLSVEVAALRANESPPSRETVIRLSLELPMRLALAVVSGVLCALHLRWSLGGGWVEDWFSVSTLASFLFASFIGVTIVLVAVRFLIPLRVTVAFWFLGIAASQVGGVAMYTGFEVLGDTAWTTVVSFCVWHVLVCVAIYRGRQSNDARSGLLAEFARTRGRFSIVPGWLKLSHATLA